MLPKLRFTLVGTLALLSFALGPASGAETFRNPFRIPTSVDPASIAVGDLNGDGHPDIVVINAAAAASNTPATFQVFLAQPSGNYLSGAQVAFPAGTSRTPNCLLADVNRDTRLDLVCAVPNSTHDAYAVLPGNGDGTFQTAVVTTLTSTPGYANSLLSPAGDLNGDGIPDFFTEEVPTGVNFALLSDGKGGFNAVPAPNGINYGAPSFIDVNGDGKLDLLWPYGPEVALGNGDGSFQPIVSYAQTSYYAANCVFQDMDGDSHPDAVCGAVSYSSAGSTQLVILHGNPNGSFSTTPIVYKTFGDTNVGESGYGAFRTPFGVFDLNGDGILDILAYSGDGIAVLLGGPGLTYSTPLHYAQAVVGFPGYVSYYQSLVSDMNGDGIPDLIAAGPNGVYITYGRKDGTLSSAFAPEVANIIGYPSIADFNGDGILDIAATGDTNIKLSLGKGDGTFSAPAAISNGGINFSTPLSATQAHILHGDFNGDGKQDLIAIGSPSIYSYDSYLLFGHGDGTFDPPRLLNDYGLNYNGVGDYAVVDINGDKRDDILTLNSIATFSSTQIGFLISQGDGTFTPVSTSILSEIASNGSYVIDTFPALGDFNQDGKPDVVTGALNNLYVLTGKGDGTFPYTTTIPLPPPPLAGLTSVGSVAVATGDFDGDTKSDIVVLMQYQTTVGGFTSITASAAWVYYGNGDLTFSAPKLVGVFNRAYANIAASDLNLDGLSDLVLKTSGTVADMYAVSVVHAQPSRTFGPEINYIAGTGVSSLSIVDLNRDGSPDLVFGNGDYNIKAGSVTVLLSVGNAVTGAVYATPEPSLFSSPFSIGASLTPSNSASLGGSVSFSVDGTSLGSAPVSFNAATIAGPTTLAVGSHHLSATWSGDTNFGPVVLNGTHTVTAYPTTTTLTCTPASIGTGSSAQLVATVASAFGTPDGNVVFTDSGTALSTRVLSGGTTFLPYIGQVIGPHTITATYLASGNFATSSSTCQITVFNQPMVTGKLTASPEPSAVGAPFSLTATLAPPVPGPALIGNVSFTVDGASVGSAALSANVATINVSSPLSYGSHQVTATWPGDASYPPLTLTSTHVVTAIPLSGTLTASPEPSSFAAPFTITATFVASNATPVSGAIAFAVDGVSIGSSNLSNNTASIAGPANLNPGIHQLTAIRAADATFQITTLNGTHTVSLIPLSLALTSSPNTSTLGQNVTFTSTFTPTYPSGTILRGYQYTANLSLYDGTTLIAQQRPTVSGFLFNLSNLSVGSHNITAVYAGDAIFSAATSNLVVQVVTASPTSTTLTAAPNPAYQGQVVTLTASVASNVIPTGTVTFYDAATSLGTATVNASGQAVLVTSTLAVGTHPISATFAATSTFATSTSSTVSEVILPSTFTLTLDPSSLTLGNGQPGTSTLHLGSVGNFSGPLALTFTGLPAYAAATITPATVTLTAGGTGTAVFALTTQARAANEIPTRPGSRQLPIVFAAALVLLLPLRRKFRGRLKSRLLTLALAVLCLQALTGCSNVFYVVHTVAPGTYQIPITATDVNHNTQTATLTLTVLP